MKKENKVKLWLSMLAFLATLLVNYAGASGLINGLSQKDISDKYQTLITPAGFAFSIWGLIYLLLFASLLYLLWQGKKAKVERMIPLISPYFISSSLFNIGWILAFSYEQIGLSTLLILGLLLSLLLLVEKLYQARSELAYPLPALAFSLYAGWVFVASILNVAVFLVKLDWQGFGLSPGIWTIVVLILALAFVFYYWSRFKNAAFALSVAWAFYGIWSSYQADVHQVAEEGIIQFLLGAGILVFLLASLGIFLKNGQSIFPKH